MMIIIKRDASMRHMTPNGSRAVAVILRKGVFFMDENKVDFEKITPAERLKYEVAEEIGLADKVRQYGWRSLTAKESGRIGGLMTKKRREMKQNKKG